MRYVTVSKPRCGWSGAPSALPGAYTTGPIWSIIRNGSVRVWSIAPGNGRRTGKPAPSNEAIARPTSSTGRGVPLASATTGNDFGSTGVTAGMTFLLAFSRTGVPQGSVRPLIDAGSISRCEEPLRTQRYSGG